MTETFLLEPLTLVFTDIKNSSEMTTQEEREFLDQLVSGHNKIILEQMDSHGGAFIKFTGDGFMLTFQQPGHAVLWAVETQKALAKHHWSTKAPLQIRIGIHCGEALRIELPDGKIDYVGFHPNQAARVMDSAEGGQIFLSGAAKELALPALDDDLFWRDRGLYDLKGIGRISIWEVSDSRLLPERESTSGQKRYGAASRATNLRIEKNAFFLGRDALLEEVHTGLSHRRRVYLTGLGGAGKTQIAAEYAHSRLDTYNEGVFWINARSSQQIRSDMAEIGSLYFRVDANGDLDRRVAQTRTILSQLKRPVLLIFDDLTDANDLEWLPSSDVLHILVTTQNQVLPESFQKIEVPALDEESALKILQRHRPVTSQKEAEAARRICEKVGCLPLALALISSDMVARGGGFSNYYTRLCADLKQVLHKGRDHFLAITHHKSGVYDTFELACEGLSHHACTLLATIACFAPRSISDELLCEASGLTRSRYEEAVTELWRRSLLVNEHAPDDDGTPRRTAQALLQLYAQDRFLSRRAALICRVVQVMTKHLCKANEGMEWSEVRRELTHFQALARFCREKSHQPKGWEMFLFEIGRYLFEERKLAGAAEHYQEALAIVTEKNGRESLQYALFLRHLGLAEQESGAAQKALQNTEEALKIAADRLSPNAPELAEFYNSLGYVLKKQGYLEQAMPMYRGALDIYKQAYGLVHPDVAMCLNNIGAARESLGLAEEAKGDTEQAARLWQEALAYFREALEIDVSTRGTHHVTVAVRLNNMGRVLGKQDNWQAALDCHHRALRINLEAHPPLHTDVGASYYYIGWASKGLNRPDNAIHAFEQAFAIFSHNYGEDCSLCNEIQAAIGALH